MEGGVDENGKWRDNDEIPIPVGRSIIHGSVWKSVKASLTVMMVDMEKKNADPISPINDNGVMNENKTAIEERKSWPWRGVIVVKSVVLVAPPPRQSRAIS